VKLSDKALLLVMVPLLFEVVFIVSLTQLLRETEVQAQSEFRSREIVSHLNNLLRLVLESSLSLASADKKSQPQESKMGTASSIQELKTLKLLVKDRPEEEQAIARIEQIIAEASRTLDSTKQHLEAGNNFAIIFEARRLRPLVERLSVEVDRMIELEEQRQSLSPATASMRRQEVQRLLWLGVILNVALAISLAVYFNRSTAVRLATLMKNTHKMAHGEALEPALPGDDEIAALDSVFHDMATSIRQAQQLKEEFLAMITHDLRTPLSSIEGTLTLLSEGVYDKDPIKGKARIEAAHANVERLLRLVNQLLDLEKLKAGMVQLNLEPVNMMELLQKSINAVVPETENSCIKTKIEGQTPIVLVDSERLIQVLVNLLGNAQKFSPDGEQISVCCGQTGESVEISISDRGLGVPADQRETIFEKFTQASTRLDRSGKSTGTGLGLAICKSIVQAHGGTIGVKPNEPSGSVFWLRLPLVPQAKVTK